MAIQSASFVTYLGALALVCFSTGMRVRLLVQSVHGWQLTEAQEHECTEGELNCGKDILNTTLIIGTDHGTVASIMIREGDEPLVRLHLPGWRLSESFPISRITDIIFG